MSAMIRHARSAVLFAAIPIISLAIPPHAPGQDVQQYLRDQYRGKTFVLRAFPVGDVLHYDSAGAPDSASSGDWTTDGFVQVTDIHLSDDRLIIKGQRMVAARLDGQFQLRPLERAKGSLTKKELVHVEIKADPGMHNPSQEQVDAVVSKIFLTSQDTLGNLVPDYWQPCVRAGLKGTDKNCAFAPEVLAIPGLASGSTDSSEADGASGEPNHSEGGPFPVGKGVRPPRAAYEPEPEFSDAARVAKYQGIVTLSVVVNREGSPTNIRIAQPLGYGLDAKAVQAVEGWKFTPAEKDGQPVAVHIMVEVQFHLY